MKKIALIFKSIALLSIVVSIIIFTSCINQSGKVSISQGEIDSLRNQIKELTVSNKMISQNLATFDTLDFTVFTNQQWTRLHESHSKDIKVNWPMDILHWVLNGTLPI